MVSGKLNSPLARVIQGTLLLHLISPVLPAQENTPVPPRLRIEDCIEKALQHNLALQAERIDPELAREQTQIARGEFDPALNAMANTRTVQQSSSRSDLDGSDGPRNESIDARIGVSKKVDTGATVSVSTNMGRVLTNSEFSTLNPAYDADVSLTLRQPLLNGFGTDVNRAARNRSLVGVDRADFVLQSRVLDIVQQTEAAFYNLAFQRATLRVRQSARDVAEKFLEENRFRRSSGMATNLDVTQAEVGLADQNALVLDSEQGVNDAEDLLRTLIGDLPFDTPIEELEVDLSTGEIPSVAAAYGTALKFQPEYHSAVSFSEQLKYDVILARSGSKPNLDLGGAVGFTGLDDSYRNAYEGVPTGDGYHWQIDLTLNVPWGRREGRARLRQTELILQREELRIQDLERTMMMDIRKAVRAAETGVERVNIAQLRSRLSREEYELEKAKFEAGLSTSRLVLDAQQRADQARVSEFMAFVELKNAWSELQRVQGISLSTYGIAMLPPPAESGSKSEETSNSPAS
ncbi:MAG: TolC family protein [Opitutaceae bacterium]